MGELLAVCLKWKRSSIDMVVNGISTFVFHAIEQYGTFSLGKVLMSKSQRKRHSCPRKRCVKGEKKRMFNWFPITLDWILVSKPWDILDGNLSEGKPHPGKR